MKHQQAPPAVTLLSDDLIGQLRANIPAELQALPNWVLFKRLPPEPGKKPRKSPICVTTGEAAKHDDPSTWSRFPDALQALAEGKHGTEGIAFAIADPYCGADFDGCRNLTTGVIAEDVMADVRKLGTYSEVSVSGTGVKSLGKARLPLSADKTGRRKGDFEIYHERRFFWLTGQRLPDSPSTIEDRQAEFSDLLRRRIGDTDSKKQSTTPPPKPCDLADAEIVDAVRRLIGDDKLDDLWAGKWEGLYPSQSEADLALLGAISRVTRGDRIASERVFGQSGLAQRDKWQEREDYRESTWETACQGLPTDGGVPPEDMADIGFSIVELAELPPDPAKVLLGTESLPYLRVGGSLLVVGPSGVGKSTLGIQEDILWSLGRDACGIPAARPLSILTIQAENDLGDMRYTCSRVLSALNLSLRDRGAVSKRTKMYWRNDLTSKAFLDYCDRKLSQHTPDILRIDPLQGFLGDDPSDPKAIAAFCRNGLNVLAKKHGCGVVLVHHTPKTNRSDRDTSKWSRFEWQYAGTGSADLTNWARAVLVLNPEGEGLFRFVAAKRSPGWKDAQGESVYQRFFRHGKHEVLWREASSTEVSAISKKGRPRSAPVESHVKGAMDIVGRVCPCVKSTLEERFWRELTDSRPQARTLMDLMLDKGLLVAKAMTGRGNPVRVGTPEQIARSGVPPETLSGVNGGNGENPHSFSPPHPPLKEVRRGGNSGVDTDHTGENQTSTDPTAAAHVVEVVEAIPPDDATGEEASGGRLQAEPASLPVSVSVDISGDGFEAIPADA